MEIGRLMFYFLNVKKKTIVDYQIKYPPPPAFATSNLVATMYLTGICKLIVKRTT